MNEREEREALRDHLLSEADCGWSDGIASLLRQAAEAIAQQAPAVAAEHVCPLGCADTCKAQEHGCARECPAMPHRPPLAAPRPIPCAGTNCGTTTAQHSPECAAEHAAACAPRVQEAVGEVGTMPGTTGFGMAAFKLSDVPLGTKLYTAPQPTAPAAAEPDMRAICEAPGFDPTNHHNAAKCPYCRPAAAPVEAPQPAEPSKDAERLDWVIQQGDEFSLSVISDAPGDGDVQAWGMNHVFGRGVTARDAIDAARAAQAQGEKGAGCTAPK